jgi:DNA-binding NarL/FixJ family response regulator
MTRVLVCDDHPIVLEAIEGCLRSILPDCEIGTCCTMSEAVKRLGDAPPGHWDLVLLDLGLPDARGVDTLIRLRDRAPRVPIAVLSALDDRVTVARAMRAGAIDFLPKTADRTRLLRTLRRLLGVRDPADGAAGDGASAEPGGRIPTAAEPGADLEWVREVLSGLSLRQMQVLRLLVRGLPNKEVCAELGVSENTVKIHISTVLRALRARNRTEAVGLVSRIGFGSD